MGHDPTNSAQDVVAVLGMHRSGTSCLVGCLQDAGLELGDVHTHAPYNPKGNRESQQIANLNDDVLAHSGGSWYRPPDRLRWTDAHSRRRSEIIGLFAGSPAWGFKDPRTLLTLDFWLEDLPYMSLVGTFRHPVLVVQSIERRTEGESHHSYPLPRGVFGSEYWMELWVAYNQRLLEVHNRSPFPLIDFDQPADAYLARVHELISALGLTVPAEGLTFFEDSLRLSRFAGDVPLPAHVEELYDALQRAAEVVPHQV